MSAVDSNVDQNMFGSERQGMRDRKRERANGLVNYSLLTFLPSVILVDRFRQA